MSLRACLREVGLALALATVLPTATAGATPSVVDLVAPPSAPLGEALEVLAEPGPPLSWAEARAGFDAGRALPAASPVISGGIGHRPIWVRLVVDNPTDRAVSRHLAVAESWIDRLAVHVLHDGRPAAVWQTGDEVAGAPHLDEALGYLFAHDFPPGRSEILIRAATPDPLVLGVRLFTPEGLRRAATGEHYAYGFVYGFLASLALYNLILFVGLGRRNSLFYALYLLGFLAMNLAYTGRGLAWLWTGAPEVQRYVILVLMTLFAIAGLSFAREFLELRQHSPRLSRVIQRSCVLMAALMLVAVLADRHEAAAWLAFAVAGGFSVVMIPLGVHGWRRRQPAAGYFLVAVVASTIGICATTFSVWGLFPLTPWTFRGVEIGIMLEAILLALALARFVRVQLEERRRAERDARVDALTRLANRRGFLEQVQSACQVARRHGRPLSVVLLDIDHFKSINDRHGHAVGDQVLAKVGLMLAQAARRGDFVARWGGEEFILLLPETGLAAALDLAERLRAGLAGLGIGDQEARLRITGSFGVAQLAAGQDLAAVIEVADRGLYLAKQGGRNRVAHCA